MSTPRSTLMSGAASVMASGPASDSAQTASSHMPKQGSSSMLAREVRMVSVRGKLTSTHLRAIVVQSASNASPLNPYIPSASGRTGLGIIASLALDWYATSMLEQPPMSMVPSTRTARSRSSSLSKSISQPTLGRSGVHAASVRSRSQALIYV